MLKSKRIGEPLHTQILLGLAGAVAIALLGCHSDTRKDTLIQTTSNPSHTYRASVVIRQYYVDGKFDTYFTAAPGKR